MEENSKFQDKGILVLIVDDHIGYLRLIENILSLNKYERVVASNFADALKIADKKHPDLILLDIMMPEMDGYEVCKKLKANEKTKQIPVIFLTAKNETEDIVKGFQLGAVDYITKPFKHEELLVRIQNQIDLKRSSDIIIEQNEKLKQLNQEKNDFFSIVAHDLKNSTKVIVGFSKLIEEQCSNFSVEEIKEYSRDVRESGESMFDIIADFLDINTIEEGNLSLTSDYFNIDNLIARVIEHLSIRAKEKNITLHFKDSLEDNYLTADRSKVKQILDNLISNAIKFSPFDKNIRVKSYKVENGSANQNFIRIEVKDEGPGISTDDMNKLFIKFARLSARPTSSESSTGLGLSIVRRLVEMMNGRIWCESESGKGADFIFELPCE